MIRFTPVFLILVFSLTAHAYKGKDSSEATLRFEHWVEIKSGKQPAASTAVAAINKQLQHLFGPMGRADFKAAPKEDHELGKKLRMEQLGGKWRVHYSYEGTIVLQNGPKTKYSFPLPNNPKTIYDEATVKKEKVYSYPCTDEYYDGEGDFWYFWDPKREGCKLERGKHYQIVDGNIERIRNTSNTYPEYDRMVENDEIRVSFLMGLDKDEHSWNPIASEGKKNDDLNAENFRLIRDRLLEMGFESQPWTDEEILAMVRRQSDRDALVKLPYAEDLVFTYPEENQRVKRMVITMFFGPTVDEVHSSVFHYFLEDGVEKSSLMIYDGHSGLGGTLFLPAIERERGFRFNPKKDRYQIFFFNSCSSYTYYNAMFFNRKKTTKDPRGSSSLDIITTGLETAFDGSVRTNMALIGSIHDWAYYGGGRRKGYKKIAELLDDENLLGINGDEDNPKN